MARPLVVGFGQDELPIGYQGAVPRTVAEPHRRRPVHFAGHSHQLDLTEPDRLNSLHGLVVWEPWRVQDAGARRRCGSPTGCGRTPVIRSCSTSKSDTRLGDNGLTFELAATNAGDTAAPYGGSFHPYLVAGEGDVDGWTVQSPAASYLTVDPERLLPRDVVPVSRGGDEQGFDFRHPTSLRGIEVDHAFTDIAFDEVPSTARGRPS